MDNSLRLWVMLLVNLGVLITSGLLAGLSYLAYRRSNGQPSFLFAVLGFGLIVISSLIDPMYLFGVDADLHLTGVELLILKVIEDSLLVFGLGTLFYAILQHDTSVSSTENDKRTSIPEERPWQHNQRND